MTIDKENNDMTVLIIVIGLFNKFKFNKYSIYK